MACGKTRAGACVRTDVGVGHDDHDVGVGGEDVDEGREVGVLDLRA